MNNEEVLKLAKETSSKPIPWNGEYPFRNKKELLAFANACEKIGMEKSRDATIDECNEYLSTDALLALKKVTR